MLKGTIIKGIGGFYYVNTEQGIYACRARGIFRKDGIKPTVGDSVEISVLDEKDKETLTKKYAGEFDRLNKENTEALKTLMEAVHPAPAENTAK